MKRLGLVKDDAHNQEIWRSLTTENRPTLPQRGYEAGTSSQFFQGGATF